MPISATHIWRPSRARRLVLDSFVPVPRGTLPIAPPSLIWPAKDPFDVLDYEFDISSALVGNEGDAIDAAVVTVTPDAVGDLTLNSVAADGATVVVWLAGGRAGTVYSVQITATTRSGRTIGRTVLLPVLSLATAIAPPSGLTTDQGALITDEAGNPLLIGS